MTDTPDYDLRLRPHKVASACLPFDLGPYVTVHQKPVAEEGAAIACRVLTSRKEYGHLELASGRKARLVPGDLIVGVLGNRAALRGFCGRVPSSVQSAATCCTCSTRAASSASSDGEPRGPRRTRSSSRSSARRCATGAACACREHAIARRLSPAPVPSVPPVLILVGTCMNSGKTTAAAVHHPLPAHATGVVVHDGQGDRRGGHQATCSDVRSTTAPPSALSRSSTAACRRTCYHDDVPDTTLDAAVAPVPGEQPDCHRPGVRRRPVWASTASTRSLSPTRRVSTQHVTGAILAANDVIGAVGRSRACLQRWGIEVRVVTGPATDNAAGTRKLEQPTGCTAASTCSMDAYLGRGRRGDRGCWHPRGRERGVSRLRVGVVGANGFLGGEVVRLLSVAPRGATSTIAVRRPLRRIGEPERRSARSLVGPADGPARAQRPRPRSPSAAIVAFLALPHGASAQIGRAPALRAHGTARSSTWAATSGCGRSRRPRPLLRAGAWRAGAPRRGGLQSALSSPEPPARRGLAHRQPRLLRHGAGAHGHPPRRRTSTRLRPRSQVFGVTGSSGSRASSPRRAPSTPCG